MSYKKLEIWQLAREIVIDIHHITVDHLPKFEMYETGGQIRRSSKSTRFNIVEGYGRRIYKQEFIRFLTYAIASNDETMDALDTLFETKSFTNEDAYLRIKNKIELLGKKLNNFITTVNIKHNTQYNCQEPLLEYSETDASIQHPVSGIRYQSE